MQGSIRLEYQLCRSVRYDYTIDDEWMDGRVGWGFGLTEGRGGRAGREWAMVGERIYDISLSARSKSMSFLFWKGGETRGGQVASKLR